MKSSHRNFLLQKKPTQGKKINQIIQEQSFERCTTMVLLRQPCGLRRKIPQTFSIFRELKAQRASSHVAMDPVESAKKAAAFKAVDTHIKVGKMEVLSDLS